MQNTMTSTEIREGLFITFETYPQENYTDDDYQDSHLTVFTIPSDKLQEVLDATFEEKPTAAEYVLEWTWDDAVCVYETAKKLGFIIEEKIIERRGLL